MHKKQPVIIRRRKSNIQSDFHGGSWKLAYADFVTALMAFFLLLWLLNATPDKKLKVIAQYFMPTLSFLTQEQKEGGSNKIGIKEGVKRVGDIVDTGRKGERIDVSEIENKIFAEMESKVQDVEKESADTSKSISYRRTADGLEITIHNQGQYKVFDQENAQLTDFAKRVLNKVIKIIKLSPNLIQIIGYAKIAGDSQMDNYGSWELSADRANATRKFLLLHGVSADKIQEVVARTNPSSLVVDSSHSVKDASITITILRNPTIDNQKISVPQDGE